MAVNEEVAGKKPPQWRIALCNLGAGAIAGCTVEAVLYPLDTIKTRLQAATSKGDIRQLLQSGGGKALYAGVWGNLVGVAPASALFIAAYEPAKRWAAEQLPPERQQLGTLFAGALGGLTASLVRVPTEVVKQRLQCREFSGPMEAVRRIVAREGAGGLYAGYGAFLLRDLPFDAIQFCIYESMRRGYRPLLHRDINHLETSVIGGIAGAVTGAVTTPLDVIKTRLMTQGAGGQYRGLLDCMRRIAQEEGLGAFMKGWQPRVTWIAIGGCVFFTALESSKHALAPAGYNPKTE